MTRVVSSQPTCIREGCNEPGAASFVSHPDDTRCPLHHDRELQRRIAAVAAAAGVFKALVG